MTTRSVNGGIYCSEHDKRSWSTRKLAKRWARIRHPGEVMSEYPCEHLQMWHIGHTPKDVISGLMSREDLTLDKRQRMDKIAALNARITELETELRATLGNLEALIVASRDAAETLAKSAAMIDRLSDENTLLREQVSDLWDRIREIGG